MGEVQRPRLPAWSLYGTGISLLGYERQKDDTYLVTRWITVLFFPLMPLSSWIIRPLESRFLNVGAAMGESHTFTIVRRAPLTAVTILRTYAYALTLAVVALLPAAGLFGAGIIQTLKKTHNTICVLLFLVAVVWPVVVLGWLNKRINRIYDAAAGAGMMPNNQMQRKRSTLPRNRSPHR